ncbi:hypothetical protein, partial [Pseudomonas viridiflava]|uniref:hypothetical protein n=1 Tax=Pseudomonas viridiflava TaxID=33069 RepID=UPI0019D00181
TSTSRATDNFQCYTSALCDMRPPSLPRGVTTIHIASHTHQRTFGIRHGFTCFFSRNICGFLMLQPAARQFHDG